MLFYEQVQCRIVNIFFLVFQKNYFGFLFEKKRNWKTWEFESGCNSDEDKEKNIGLFDFVEFYTGLNF